LDRKPYPGAPVTRHFQVDGSKPIVESRLGIGERNFRRLLGRFDRLSQVSQYAAALILMAIIGAVDAATGYEIQLSILYLIPVAGVAWYRGVRAGRAFAVIAMIVWFVADRWNGHQYSRVAILYWNTAVRGMFFGLFALLLSQLRLAMNKAQRLARTDSLTNVANGRHFLEIATSEIARQQRYGKPLSVAFLDCDNFKDVNDIHGHAAGDDVLRTIADTIQRSLRSVDCVARLGGDEFALLLPETDAKAARVVVDKIREAWRMTSAQNPVTFSIGVVTYLQPPADVDELLHAADDAMYDAKRLGKNSVQQIIADPRIPKINHAD
jgi:diguanylate cyclase (GGDEF)-like protein